MVLELGGRRRLALAAAFVAVLNPITWFDSVVWGQVDSFGVVFLLLGLRELWRDRPERAAIYTVIAAIIKPQLGILVPLVAVVTIRRALWPIRRAATATRHATGRPRPDPDDRPRRARDGGRPVACRSALERPVGLIQQIARRRRRLPVPDGQRLQPVGARPVRPRHTASPTRPVGLRRAPSAPTQCGSGQRRLRGRPGRRSSGSRCSLGGDRWPSCGRRPASRTG